MFDTQRAVVEDLKAWVADLQGGCITGEQAKDLVALASEGERLFAAARVLATERVAETGAWRQGGAVSAAAWLGRVTGMEAGRAGDAVKTAGGLAGCRPVDVALRSGVLSEAQAHVIIDAATVCPDEAARLVEFAATHSVRQLIDECRRVKTTAAGADDEAARVHRERSFRTWVGRNGEVCWAGRTTPEAGAPAMAAIEALQQQLIRAARKEGQREPFEAYAADAFVQLVTEGLGGNKAGSSPRAQVMVHVDYEALVRGSVAGEEMCEIRGIGPIPVSAARRLLADSILRVVVRKGGQPYTITPGVRTIPAAVRRIVEATERECAVPGCGVTRGLEFDHILPWAEHGLHDPANICRLCKRHHDNKTYGDWEVGGPPGARTWTPPAEEVDDRPGNWLDDPAGWGEVGGLVGAGAGVGARSGGLAS